MTNGKTEPKTNLCPRYYEQVLELYAHGKTAREIAKIGPISKSTIKRWVDSRIGKDEKELLEGVTIPHTPKAVAKMILSMSERIARLEEELEKEKRRTALLDKIVSALAEYELLKNYCE